MIRLLKTLWYVALLAPAAARANDEPEPLIQVMVLGTYHFANPGQDVVNMEADDVLADQRQQELAALAEALITFSPTKVLVENQTAIPDFLDPEYEQFTIADLRSQRNETVQIGCRTANLAGHEVVFGFDEQPGEGEPDYFPFGEVTTFAEANGQSVLIEAIYVEVGAAVAQMGQDQATLTIPQILRKQNDDAVISRLHNLAYNGLLAVGDGERQPGAELNALWFMRNAKNVRQIGFDRRTRRPIVGDRKAAGISSGSTIWLKRRPAMKRSVRDRISISLPASLRLVIDQADPPTCTCMNCGVDLVLSVKTSVGAPPSCNDSSGIPAAARA